MPKNCDARPFFSPSRLWTPLLLALVLTGCAVSPVQEETRVLAPVPTAELDRASALLSQGKPADAARLYLDLAAKAQPPAKAQLQLKAARAHLTAGQTTQARQVLEGIPQQGITPDQRELLLLTRADLALAMGHPKEAITDLQRMQAQGLSSALKAKRLGTLASAQRLDNQPLAAAESLSALDQMLPKDERLANQVALISTLSQLGASELQNLTRAGRGPMKGWAEIALLARQSGMDPGQLETRYRQWRQTHLMHPALADLGRAYAVTLSGGYASTDRVAVLLPDSGRFAAAAKVVRDGIEAASRTDRSEKRPTLEFIDSSNAGRVRALHARASKQGARYVIGPLEKPAVDALAAAGTLGIPTLALNEATRPDRRAGNLFQFSLSPENEATEVAGKAAAMGAKRALILYPSDAWGQRLANAFERRWQKLGGAVVGQTSFDPAATSHDKTLTKLLDGKDADMLFLVATADMARKIHPRIQALAGKSLKVFSTSHVYAGHFDATRDTPLIGLYFVDIPWMLDTNGSGPLSRRALASRSADTEGPLARLYAMGIDAYGLAPRLTELAKNPGAFHPGQTGGLAIDPLGRITRQLELGQFTASGPRRAEPN